MMKSGMSIGTMAVMLAAVVGITGCANLASIGRRTSTTDAKAIHLDAKQRVVMTKANGAVYCAEPSPDALSAYATSLGVGASSPGGDAASLAAAFSEGSGSIGLRTQTITLLRDSLYRICESAYNDKLDSVMVAQLHTRFQDITIGLLAIEQLTGAVVAKQVLLTGRASADAMASAMDAETNLREAERRETLAKERKEQSDAKVEAATATRDVAQGAVDTGMCADGQANAGTQGCQAPRQDLTDADEELQAAEDQQKRDQERLERATKRRELAETMESNARSAAQAAASNTGQFAGGSSGSNISDQTAETISHAVVQIVDTVVGKNRILDSCLVILSMYAEALGKYDTPDKASAALFMTPEQIESVQAACIKVIVAQAENRT